MSEEYSLSIRAFHPSMPYEKISETLGFDADYGWSGGQQRKTPAGRFLEGRFKGSYCYFNIGQRKEGYFVDGIRDALGVLDERKESVVRFVDDGGRVELFVGVFSDGGVGFTLTCDDARAFSQLLVDVSVEVYAG